MNSRVLGARTLSTVGAICFLAGALDPLEGAVVILAGGGLILGGDLLRSPERRAVRFWTSVLGLIAFGVGMMIGLSSAGGIGGESGRSWWWGLLMLPYPVGWLLGVGGLIVRLVRLLRPRVSPRGT